MSDYAKEFLFLRSELDNCRIKNQALEYRLYCRLQGWADHIIQSGMLPFAEWAL